jgi:hypothetical protein
MSSMQDPTNASAGTSAQSERRRYTDIFNNPIIVALVVLFLGGFGTLWLKWSENSERIASLEAKIAEQIQARQDIKHLEGRIVQLEQSKVQHEVQIRNLESNPVKSAGVSDPQKVLHMESTSKSNLQSPANSTAKADMTLLRTALCELIRDAQKSCIRESFGTLAGENFSDEDLADFKRDNKAEEVAERYGKLESFRSIVSALGGLNSDQRDSLLSAALGTSHKTWSQLKKVSAEGQTVAGVQAELLVAQAIVNRIKSSL